LELDRLWQVTAPEGSTTGLPRALLVFAHPDDEVIAVGGRMGRFAASHFLHVTDGAPRNEQDSRSHGFARLEDYRRARRQEFEAMLAEAGIPDASRECLAVADQEASLHLIELTERLAERIEQYRPEAIFTHAYEGGHPDHDACAFAVHHAVGRCDGAAVAIVEAPFYNLPFRGQARFLDRKGASEEIVYKLSAAERERKDELFACFTTQRETLRAFDTAVERYRLAPAYEFCAPPHDSPVLYDEYAWGMDSQRFSELAREAEEALETKPGGSPQRRPQGAISTR
jgi:LmbE family N-acetylglucosaminyl deacetylase